MDHLRNLPIADGGELEVIGMDLFNPDSVDVAIAGCSDLIHTAATVVVRSKDPQRKIVDPSVIGTQNVISAVEKSGTIKRIVHTSSTAAIGPWIGRMVLYSPLTLGPMMQPRRELRTA